MALTKYYLNPNASGANDGTSWSDAWETWDDVESGLDTALASVANGIELQVYDGYGNGGSSRGNWTNGNELIDITNSGTKPVCIRGVTAEDTYGWSYWADADGGWRVRGKCIVTGIDVLTSDNAPGIIVGYGAIAYKCKVVNTNATNGYGIAGDYGGTVMNCYISTVAQTNSYGIGGYRFNAINNLIIASRYGILQTDDGYFSGNVSGNVIIPYGSSQVTGIDLRTSNQPYAVWQICDNRIHNFTNGINLGSLQLATSIYGPMALYRNIIGNCTNGINTDDEDSSGVTNAPPSWDNVFANCTNNWANYATETKSINDITLGYDPFTDGDNGNLSLNTTAFNALKTYGFAKNMTYDWSSWADQPTYE